MEQKCQTIMYGKCVGRNCMYMAVASNCCGDGGVGMVPIINGSRHGIVGVVMGGGVA